MHFRARPTCYRCTLGLPVISSFTACECKLTSTVACGFMKASQCTHAHTIVMLTCACTQTSRGLADKLLATQAARNSHALGIDWSAIIGSLRAGEYASVEGVVADAQAACREAAENAAEQVGERPGKLRANGEQLVMALQDALQVGYVAGPFSCHATAGTDACSHYAIDGVHAHHTVGLSYVHGGFAYLSCIAVGLHLSVCADETSSQFGDCHACEGHLL